VEGIAEAARDDCPAAVTLGCAARDSMIAIDDERCGRRRWSPSIAAYTTFDDPRCPPAKRNASARRLPVQKGLTLA
jgi:hypothetical protein